VDWDKVDNIPDNINISGVDLRTLEPRTLDQSVRETGERIGCIFQLPFACKYVLDLQEYTRIK